MRKKTKHQLLTIAKADPNGMSTASYREVKRIYNSGLTKLTQPKVKLSKRQQRLLKINRNHKKGFPLKSNQHIGGKEIILVVPSNKYKYIRQGNSVYYQYQTKVCKINIITNKNKTSSVK